MTLDHIAVAVKEIDATLKTLALLGLSPGERGIVPEFGVEVCMLPVGEAKLELLQPTKPESTIAKFIERRGEGIHHIALRVPDIRAVLAQSKAQGFALIDEVPRLGFGGHSVAFIHPHSTHGVLIELVEERKELHRL
jgi:methylmalonyl-CoA/ethylmalonyl-CoA epimerase